MAKYLISFPSAAMRVLRDELETVARDAHAVIDQAMTPVEGYTGAMTPHRSTALFETSDA